MLNNIQALRAFAVFLAVYHHMPAAPFFGAGDPWGVGHMGVDLFFVISGFVMSYSTSGRALGMTEFWMLRIIRIVPLYWLVTLAVFVLAIAQPRLFSSAPTDAISLIKSLLFIPFARETGAMQPVISVGWTLNYEMFFYLLFGLTLLLKSEFKRLLAMTAAMGALVCLGALVRTPQPLAFYTAPIMLEFLAGMWAFWLTRTVRLERMAEIVSACVAIVAGLALAFWPRPYPDLEWGRVIAFGLPSAMIVYGMVLIERQGLVIRNALVLAIGAASYSIYLSHAFIIRIVYQLLVHDRHPGPLASLLMFAATFAVLTLAGWLSFRLIETPITKWLRPQRRPAKPAAAQDVAETTAEAALDAR